MLEGIDLALELSDSPFRNGSLMLKSDSSIPLAPESPNLVIVPRGNEPHERLQFLGHELDLSATLLLLIKGSIAFLLETGLGLIGRLDIPFGELKLQLEGVDLYKKVSVLNFVHLSHTYLGQSLVSGLLQLALIAL